MSNPRLSSGAMACRISTILLTGTILAGGGIAYADDGSLEERVDRLEGMLQQILDRMDNQDARLTQQEAEIIVEARKVAAQTAQSTAVKTTRVSGSSGDGFKVGDTTIKLGGYVKLDVTASRYSDGVIANNSLGRDFYIPGTIPVGGGVKDTMVDFNPRETRFLFTTATPFADDVLKTKIEFDFQVTPGGNERVSNSFSPRMRQAYIQYKNWLFGQAWSTFQDVGALAENLDFIGPTEGTVFERQPMIRYTNGGFQFAIEQPETSVTSAAGARLLSGSDNMPDVIARYNHKGDFGHVSVAGIVRNLHIEDTLIAGVDADNTLAYGVSVAGKLKVGAKDDFRFMTTWGEGLGRYIGVNIVNGAAVNAQGELEAIETLSGFASYRHFWTDKLRSNATLGYFKADNPTAFTGTGVTDRVWSSHVNLIYTPVKKFDIGLEYIYANRKLESGADGSMTRIQFSTKYAF